MVFVSSIGGLQPSMPVNIIHLLSLDSGISTELATVDLSCQGPFIQAIFCALFVTNYFQY